MNEKLIFAQDVFLNRINQICRKFGLNNIMAQLYSILYFSDKPMSLNDMVDRLKISKGSASVNIRALERYGAVRKAWIKGSRKDFYEAEPDVYKVIMDRFNALAKNRLIEIETMVNSSLEALDPSSLLNEDDNEELKIFKQRLDELKRLHSKAQVLFNLFNSGFLNEILLAGNKQNKKNDSAEKVEIIS